jgi:hypothetical protein
VTKHKIAEAIAKHIPALDLYVPPARKPWMSENARMGIFDAAALAWLFFDSLSDRRKPNWWGSGRKALRQYLRLSPRDPAAGWQPTFGSGKKNRNKRWLSVDHHARLPNECRCKTIAAGVRSPRQHFFRSGAPRHQKGQNDSSGIARCAHLRRWSKISAWSFRFWFFGFSRVISTMWSPIKFFVPRS